MTTGPFNDNITLRRDVNYMYRTQWSDWMYYTLNQEWSALYQNVRPQSATSPVRSDFTRAPRPWSRRTVKSRKWEGIHGYVHSGGAEYYYFDSIQGLPTVPLALYPERLRRRAALNLRKNAAGMQANLGVALAEARKTAEMVGGYATTIGRQVERFRRMHPRQWGPSINKRLRGKSLRDQRITDEYLKMCYGWTPLLGEIDGASKELARLLYERPVQSLTVKGHAKESDRSNSGEVYVPNHLQATIDAHYDHYQSYACTFNVDLRSVRELSSLGLTQPEQIVWELVPYSFVVDWFLPIGSWLESMSALRGLSFKEGTLTRSSRVRATINVKERNPLPGTYRSSWCQQKRPGQYSRFEMQRIVLLQPPGVEPPDLRWPLSTDKLAKGLSLLVGAFR